jgi:AraC-like DNA-binding protein
VAGHSEPWLSWAAADYTGRERFDAFESALNDSHLRWDLEPNHTESFAGAMGLKDFGGVRVVRCDCGPCAGHRRSRQIGTDAGEYFGALLLLQGQERVRQNGREMVLNPRSMMVWDSTREIDFSADSAISKVTVFIPRRRAPQFDSLRRHCGQVIECGRGLPAVVASHLDTLATELDSIDHLEGASAVDLTVELIAASLEALEDHSLTLAQRNLMAAMESHILENLADSALTPDAIARHFSVSKRYLHQLFARSDRTVCQFISESRLDRARRELLCSATAGESITEIAGRVGFGDPAHFSRVFRQRYGVAPRDFRKDLAG